MSENGNEPAFARPESEFTHGSTGLTKREWFAGMAMQGLLANPNNQADPFSAAREAADRMLAELAKSLPTVTVDDVLSWGPCHSETKVRELAAPLGDRFDALAILRAAHITAADRLWTVLREEMIPAPILHEFACRSAEWALVLVALGGAEIDSRSADAIATKRRWLRREASDKELSAAWSAAWSAAKRAGGAAWSAAEAAWSAADDIRVEGLLALLAEIGRAESEVAP